MKRLVAVFLLACVMPLTIASAAENYTETSKNADSREKLSQVAAQVHEQMQGGGRFEFVKPDERKTIDNEFAEMDALYAKSGSVDGMSKDAKIQLFNAQETINSILTQRDGDRVICKNEAINGSRIRRDTCHTYREEVAKAEISRKTMVGWQAVRCTGGKACPLGDPPILSAGTALTH